MVNLTSDIREEKVKELKDSIENGLYDINGKQIAEKMVQEVIIDELS